MKISPSKYYSNTHQRCHPYTQFLNTHSQGNVDAKSRNYGKLLVILVDFAEEQIDDPNTTGNGKFLLEADSDYLYSIASPPHDYNYYLQNLEALKYYYLAASQGSYNLDYDVYPQISQAYTLPQPMGYYNPAGADANLFVSRMEEYFRDAFELADSLSPEIDFSSYGHYMLIHAGSDWQHDVFGDTPSDIPSFFINVGADKEAVVDNGTFLINSACNVPATISQDFRSDTSGEQTIHSGYGALNSVIAHEFGHSLGMVDLYNVYSWQPMVGVFDIMDSGGSGVLVDELDDGSLVMVEGALPVLPGAWSRVLLFEDFYQTTGFLKDIEQTDLFSTLNISACSQKQSGSTVNPQILRIPLSATEYILVENRNVDPDGDGGTAVFASEDSRVILYPTPINDPENIPSYEYDYLLPSFQTPSGAAIGGGLLVWRINDEVIYNQGVTDTDGNFISNYDNNSVNNRYSARGVEIIEADNLPDIGYDWSWYWTGTQYEYFHKNKPVLDSSGFFANWSLEEWKPTLNSITAPPLVDSHGIGSLYWLSDIGHPAADMTLMIRSGSFTDTQIETYHDPELLSGPVIRTSFNDYNIPLISSESIRLLSFDGTAWTDLMGSFAWDGRTIDFPVVRSDQNGNGFQELALVHDNALELLEFANDALTTSSQNFPDAVTSTPLALDDTLFVSTETCLWSMHNDTITGCLNIDNIRRLGYFSNDVIALSTDKLYLVDSAMLHIKRQIVLPEAFGQYEPVSFTNWIGNPKMLFLMANSGNVYKYQDAQLQKIFTSDSSAISTQMGITSLNTSSTQVSPAIFWASGSEIYAIKHDGTLFSGYPYNAYPLSFTPEAHLYSIMQYPKTCLYLPVEGHGHVAFNLDEGVNWQYSLLANDSIRGDYLSIGYSDNPETSNLFWYYIANPGDLYIQAAEVSTMNFNLVWNGFRNGATGSMIGYLSDESPISSELNAYVYPNPVRRDDFRLHVENFDQLLRVDLFDINASLLKSLSIPFNGILERDLEIDSSKLASGVYILSVKCGNNRKQVKFAVEK